MTFEDFSTPARNTLVVAQRECRLAGREQIGVEHILLGCILESDSIPAQVMDEIGVNADDIRRTVEGILGPGRHAPGRQMTFTPKASDAIRRATGEALKLGVDVVGPEHLMLAVLNVQPSFAAQILEMLGIDPEETKRRIARHAGYGSPEQVTPSKNAVLRMIGGMLFSGQLRVEGDLPENEAVLIAACLKAFTG